MKITHVGHSEIPGAITAVPTAQDLVVTDTGGLGSPCFHEEGGERYQRLQCVQRRSEAHELEAKLEEVICHAFLDFSVCLEG